MPSSRVLTVEQLIDGGATTEQVDAFREAFGDSVTITPDWVLARVEQLDSSLLATLVLNETSQGLFGTARDVALQAQAQAEVTAQAAFDTAVGPGRALVRYVLAQAFAKLYIDETPP
jgi:hypothetical protein